MVWKSSPPTRMLQVAMVIKGAGQVAAGQMAGQVADRKEGQEAPDVRRIED